MSHSVRTDLALEARQLYTERSQGASPRGVEVEEDEHSFGIRTTRVKIVSEEGSRALGKEKGIYVTMEIPDGDNPHQEAYEEACRVCAKEISGVLGGADHKNVLVLGLGNRRITADSLGPKTVDSVLITRHLLEYMPEEIDERLESVCALAPGVLGITGLETGEIVKGICQRVKPDLIIAVDALCARSMERINNTIQISDGGIVPGAGVGNARMAIDEKTLGVPVISIGVPTVVDAATVASDTIDHILRGLKENAKENLPLYKMLAAIEDEDKLSLIREVLTPDFEDFVVTPKEIDFAVDKISKIIANGINIAVHRGIGLEDVDKYM